MRVLQGWAFYWGTSEWSREQLEEVRGEGGHLTGGLKLCASCIVGLYWVKALDACKAAQLCADVLIVTTALCVQSAGLAGC